MAIVAIVFGEFPKIQHSDAGAIFVIRFISDVYKVFYLDALKIRNDHALEFVLVILLALACQLAFLSSGILHLVSQVSVHLSIAQENYEERLKKRFQTMVPMEDDVGVLTSIYQRHLVTMTGAWLSLVLFINFENNSRWQWGLHPA